MDNDNACPGNGRWFYRYFPVSSLAACVVLAMIVGQISARGAIYILLVFWPAALVYWIIYWNRKNPEVKQKNYYLVVVWAFSIVAMAIIASIIYRIAHVSQDKREEITEYLGIGVWVVYFGLAICQLWERRK